MNNLYSVFVVDEEPIVLEGIRSKIDWEGSGFSFAGEASDGEIALSMIHELKPDILVTDIKMPFMDGLELSKAVKSIQPWIKIIILSGHDEFEYAKKSNFHWHRRLSFKTIYPRRALVQSLSFLCLWSGKHAHSTQSHYSDCNDFFSSNFSPVRCLF